MNRRAFLHTSACATTAAICGCVTHSQSAGVGSVPAACAPEAWRKHGIVLEPSEPWEGNNIQHFTTAAEPLGSGAWRLWYSVSDDRVGYNVAFAEGVPGSGHMKKVAAICSAGEPADASLAIGNLPDKWRPVQATHIRLPDGHHRLYFWVHASGVCRYLVAESADGKRYRVIDPLKPVLYHPNDAATFGIPSPDGVAYHAAKTGPRTDPEAKTISRLISNDATNIYQLPDGTFEIYSVGLLRVPQTDPAYIAEDNAAGLLRVIDRYTSADGLTIDSRRRIIQRDAEDPFDQQFYYLAVTHTSRGRVGMLGHYRCKAQTMDLEWCFSTDGVEWLRPLRRAWIPRDDPTGPDGYGIYAGRSLVHQGGRWHLFYTGTNSTHNGKKSNGKPRQVVMYATTKSIWA